MLSVPVRKDISEYKSKIFGKLTLRTLIVIATALITAVAIACALQFGCGIDWSLAQWPVYMATFAIWSAGLRKPCGMPVERYAPLWMRHNLTDDRCIYAPTPREAKATRALRLSAAYSRLALTPGIEAISAHREGSEA